MELPYDPAIRLLGNTSKETKNANSKEYMHPYVHCRVIYNNQDLEAAQVSIIRWVDEKVVISLHNGILPSCKKEGNLNFCDSTDGPGDCYAKWNKPVRERQVLYDLTHMWNLMNTIH